MASGGIENLMHYFLIDSARKKQFDEITIVSSYPSIAFEDEYKESKIKVIHVPSWRQRKKYKKKIDSIINDLQQDDLLYINLSTYCNWALLSSLKKSKCKIVIHGHNAYVDSPIKKIIHSIGKKRFEKIGHKIAVSEECSKFMFGFKHNAIIPNGINSKNFYFDIKNRESARNELSIEAEKIVIGCVGRISEEKNQLYLVKLSKQYKNILFLFIGDFMSEKYKKQIYSKIQSNCLFIGSKTNVGYYLSAMDAIAIPSKHEAFPLAAVEALTNGLPIFCYEQLKKKMPLSICKNKNCHFIEDDRFDLTILTSSHFARNANDVIKEKEYDLSIFLERLYNFLAKEVFNGN